MQPPPKSSDQCEVPECGVGGVGCVEGIEGTTC